MNEEVKHIPIENFVWDKERNLLIIPSSVMYDVIGPRNKEFIVKGVFRDMIYRYRFVDEDPDNIYWYPDDPILPRVKRV